MLSSDAAIAMIVGFEIGSVATYNSKYQRPVWPGGESGVTIGIGYDLSAKTAYDIVADWSELLPSYAVRALSSMAGVRGQAAKARLSDLHSVVVPLSAAQKVFAKSLNVFEDKILKLWPTTEVLSGDSFGALVSLFYNRGFDCERSHENRAGMADLSDALSASNFTEVPGIILAMQTIWQGKEDALVARRVAEAEMFQKGLPVNEGGLVS